MSEYRKKVRQRLVYYGMGLALAIALLAVCLMQEQSTSPVPDFIAGFQAGVATGVVAFLMAVLLRNIRALKNDARLKKQFVAEHDERALMIYQKAGSVGMRITVFLLALGAVGAGFFDATVCLTLAAAAALIGLMMLAFKLYYRIKL